MLYQQNVGFFCLFLGGFHCVNGKKKCGRLLVSNHILKEKREKTKSPLYKKLCLDRHNFHRKHFKNRA